MIAHSLLQQRRLVALVGACMFVFVIVITLCSPTARLYLPGKANSLRPAPVVLEDQSTTTPSVTQNPSSTTSSVPQQTDPSWDLSIPDDYSDTKPPSKFCAERFSPKYLEDLRDHAASYCQHDRSQSNLTCFHSHVSAEADSFCIARGVSLDVEAQQFGLHCPLRALSSKEKVAGMVPVEHLRGYWYNTGPAAIFEKFISFLEKPVPLDTTTKRAETNQSAIDGTPAKPPQNYLLVKREGETNPWHSLLEIWSAWMTMDVLRISMDPARKEPYFASSEDEEDTQVVILDSRPDGPYYGMWSLFSNHDAVRMPNLTAPIPATANIIIPLAGASNPIWQNDWEVRDCTKSATLSAFTRRVLRMHGINPDKDAQHGPRTEVSVLFVDRKRSRKLVDQERLFAALRERVPHAAIRIVDFAALSFRDQVWEARRADVLVGVHGAGLTHAMWMRDGEGAVVEIQPSALNHNGFRNLALMKGLGFHRVHANSTGSPEEEEKQPRNSIIDDAGPGDHPLQRRADWHWEDVMLEEERFLEVMTVAIKSLYAKGGLNYDIN